eukprot:TRINITY_DN2228_c0_g1_i3.p1 TRINITY_DN2228_c0_g1~~TRINITY_DN2228_c0_g1_i3.p1  ORF type:complete len:196 (-),score=36.88 TRINITY_DN2228_c0_g1_i3:665-1252(-)
MGFCTLPGTTLIALVVKFEGLTARTCIVVIMLLLSGTSLIPLACALAFGKQLHGLPIFIMGPVYNLILGNLWPLNVSYCYAGRTSLERAMGMYAVCWSCAVVFALFAASPVILNFPLEVLAFVSVLHVLALVFLFWYPPNPASQPKVMEIGAQKKNVCVTSVQCFYAFQYQLPAATFMNSVLSPFLPVILSGITA